MDKEYSKFLVYFCDGIREYDVFARKMLRGKYRNVRN